MGPNPTDGLTTPRGVVIAEVADGLMVHNHLYLTPVRGGPPGIVR